jgi:hypothetical protein
VIRKQIDSPEALHKVRLWLAERIQLQYERLTYPDRYKITVTYRDRTITFENACLESGYPEPTPYAVISWMHTWCIYTLRNDKESYGEKWHASGEELDQKWGALVKLMQDSVDMFGTGFATDWNTRW